MKKLVYKGFIKEGSKGENDFALFVGETDNPIAEVFEEDIQFKQVTVRYWISNVEKTKEELDENTVLTMVGAVDADYYDRYSEYTGYLWTDEKLDIGGHDLLEQLSNSVGKFVYLEVEVHNA